jgi:hypothetical protein
MRLGIVKEIHIQERRVAASPATVGRLVALYDAPVELTRSTPATAHPQATTRRGRGGRGIQAAAYR